MAKITIAKSAGFCFGVKRAIDLAEDIVDKNNKVYTFGLLYMKNYLKRIESVDATCPFVKRTQDIVKELSNGSKQIILSL